MRRAARGVLEPALGAAAALALAACAGGPPPAPEPAEPAVAGWQETGMASWYGPGFHGRRTASGEVYDMEALTAAHRTLPFGTRVRVHNLDNGAAVEVRINDRGPYTRGRILDLSRAAARAIGMLGPGKAWVRVVVTQASVLVTCSRVQVGAFSDPGRAAELERRLRARGEVVRTEEGEDGLVRVFLGPYPDLAAAERARARHDGVLSAC